MLLSWQHRSKQDGGHILYIMLVIGANLIRGIRPIDHDYCVYIVDDENRWHLKKIPQFLRRFWGRPSQNICHSKTIVGQDCLRLWYILRRSRGQDHLRMTYILRRSCGTIFIDSNSFYDTRYNFVLQSMSYVEDNRYKRQVLQQCKLQAFQC